MNKALQFTVFIKTDPGHVWDTMLGPQTYREWTTAFCEGSYFEGSWEQGEKIRFLSPSGDGMVAVIAENRRHEFVSIRHLGEISAGVEDTRSDKVKAWAPAHENYAFRAGDGGTELNITVDTTPEFEKYMLDTYPKALGRLKSLCESTATNIKMGTA